MFNKQLRLFIQYFPDIEVKLKPLSPLSKRKPGSADFSFY